MSIRDDLVTQNEQSKIRIGQVVKKSLNGNFGEVLRALVNGMITEELSFNQDNPTMSADRHMGRCEGYNNILVKLEYMVSEMESLTQVEDEEVST